MEKMKLEGLCCKTITAVCAAGDFIRSELGKVRRGDIETKSMNSLVSYVDKKAEEDLVSALSQALPEATFLTEEKTVEQKNSQYRWVIDPLDGTTNFLHRLPCFAVSVALEKAGKPILGVVLEVNRKECFYAWQSGGAYLNGRKICTSATVRLEDALIATGFPYHDFSRVEGYLKVMEHFFRNTRGLRRFGAAAVDLAFVACGRFDAFFEYALNPWDVAAGIILVEEAGGRITDFQGGDQFYSGEEIIATNGIIQNEMLEIVGRDLLSDNSA